MKSNDPWRAHLDELFGCRRCPEVAGTPVSGAVRDAQIILVGQAPGPREQEARRPFAYTAGRRLFEWFTSIGAEEERFRESVYIAAVARCFPGRAPTGGDRPPSRIEIANCAVHLDRELALLVPELVIAVGGLAGKEVAGSGDLATMVGPLHRCNRAGVAFDAVVLPHPSGRSTWLNVPGNREKLGNALSAIATHRAFRRAFGPRV
ncbi:MAG: uracil-DNA glycosylase [Acidobacteria bacterium]|nr:uracil-DNA glycosylase [Acidobacteriota bacterium]